MRTSLSSVLDRASKPARMRYAHDLFAGRRGRLRDRLVASAYFTVASGAWGELAIDEGHLQPFALALGRLDLDVDVAVDLATGAGASAAMVARRWPSAHVEGVDSSRRMLSHARRLNHEPNLRFRRATVTRLPYPPASVDLVTSLNAIIVPLELARVCRPGAVVLAVANWVPVRPPESEWVSGWAAAGFARTAAEAVGSGSWETFVLARPGAPL